MSEVISWIMLVAVFIGLPVASVIFFIVSLVKFRRTSENQEMYLKRKTICIVSGIIATAMVTAVVVLFVMISISLAHM
ncbi:MAG: hypothetical protein K2J08_00420 [Ruminococcus sp.]|nr:hypothetical protein [Ruminococcus sp.]